MLFNTHRPLTFVCGHSTRTDNAAKVGFNKDGIQRWGCKECRNAMHRRKYKDQNFKEPQS